MTNSGQNEKIDVSKAFIFRIYNMFYLRTASKSIRRLNLTLFGPYLIFVNFLHWIEIAFQEFSCNLNEQEMKLRACHNCMYIINLLPVLLAARSVYHFCMSLGMPTYWTCADLRAKLWTQRFSLFTPSKKSFLVTRLAHHCVAEHHTSWLTWKK